ncbi:DUF3053 family protein, partial [Pantoea agglomerans]|uniref:DUF3053 family protein n=1 Tax=Enterobacter agglomerans TaxID=549 RepID=UPI003EEDBDAF
VIVTQQIVSDKIQADSSKATLMQPYDLKKVYVTAYNKVVTVPDNQLIPLLPKLEEMSQVALQTGDFLQTQGTRVILNDGGVQFPS